MTFGYSQNNAMHDPPFSMNRGTPFASPYPAPPNPFGDHPFQRNGERQPDGNPFSMTGAQPMLKPYSMKGDRSSMPRPEMGDFSGRHIGSSNDLYMANPHNHPSISAFNQGIARGLRYMDPDIGDCIAREEPAGVTDDSGAPMTRNLAGRHPGPWKRPDRTDFTPEVDVCETKGTLMVLVSLPGCKKEDCKVIWDSEMSRLDITGTVVHDHREREDSSFRFRKQERKSGMFKRSVSLGEAGRQLHIKVDAILAEMEAGVLKITIPRSEPTVVHQATVEIK
nr:heat shock protein 16 [Quercus suber]